MAEDEGFFLSPTPKSFSFSLSGIVLKRKKSLSKMLSAACPQRIHHQEPLTQSDSKRVPSQCPMVLENIMQISSWWLWTFPCTYHNPLVLEVSLFQRDCLPRQAGRFGNHWGCSVEACWAQDSSLPAGGLWGEDSRISSRRSEISPRSNILLIAIYHSHNMPIGLINRHKVHGEA